ncbi:MAG: DUF4238 domain-containing protein [Actinobacteria bacterium]|nr:MAG: DUF4238 domain-containing protein [Actinomycetota bacterium]
MPNIDLNAIEESPLVKELAEIGKGEKSLPKSDAKRHHFIPQLTLSRFATGDERLFQLDTGTGKPQRTSVYAAASRRRFYTFEDEDGKKNNDVEAYFSLVESHAAPALLRMDETGELSDIDRATIAFFLSLLWARTPGARSATEQLGLQANTLLMASHWGDPNTFMRMYRQWEAEGGDGTRLSDEEAEELREKTLREFQDGTMGFEDPGGGNTMALLLEVALQQAGIIFGSMGWALMRSDETEFISSDRGLAIFDPTPKYPWSSHAMASSPNAQTTIPISASSCLLLVPTGEPSFEAGEVSRHNVMQANLRAYGWAERFIYGSSQEAVVAVRRAARRKPQDVARPKPHRPVILVESDPEDTRLADAHRKRGWPPYLQAPGEDGKPQRFDYMVLGEDGDPVTVGVTTTELARERGMKAAGLSPNAFDGETHTRSVPLRDVKGARSRP